MTVIRVEPDTQQKLAILGAEAGDEVTDIPAPRTNDAAARQPVDFIYDAKRSGGGTTRLFELLQTNACRYA